MVSLLGCSPSPRLIKTLLITACVLLVCSGIFLSRSSSWLTGPHSIPSFSDSSPDTAPKPLKPVGPPSPGDPVPPPEEKPVKQPPTSKYAFATILTGEDNDETDLKHPYLTAARILTYQLLHCPSTKGAGNTPFLVMVTDNVPQEERDQLTRDGATVVPVKRITSEWVHPKWDRWSNVLAKLNIFKLTEYEKITFIDADSVLFQPIDSIFTEPFANPRQINSAPLGTATTNENKDAPPLPERYLIAGIHDLWVEANLPPVPGKDFYARNNYMNAGFFVLGPSEELFNYYMSILQTPDQFDPAYPEQNLLNLVHRVDGRMPWQDIGPGWNQKGARKEDYERGLKSVHQKWWEPLRDDVLDAAIANVTAEFRAFVDERDRAPE